MDGSYKSEYSAQNLKNRDIYTYVVGIRSSEVGVYYSKLQPEQQREKWIIGLFKKGAELNINEVNRKNFIPLFVESVAIKHINVKSDGSLTFNKGAAAEDEEGFNEKEINNWIASSRGKFLSYDSFLKQLSRGGGGLSITDNYADYDWYSSKTR